MANKLIMDSINNFKVGNYQEGLENIKDILTNFGYWEHSSIYSPHFMLNILEEIKYKLPMDPYLMIITDYLINKNYMNQLVNKVKDDIISKYKKVSSLDDILEKQNEVIDSYYYDKRNYFRYVFNKYNFLALAPYYELSLHLDNFYKILTENNETIYSYTYKYDYVINKRLRSGSLDTRTKKLVQKLVNLIDVCPILDDIVLYRGISIPEILKIGDIYEDKSFMSKTIDFEVAKSFERDNCCLLLFTYKNNPVKQLYLNYSSKFSGEYEFISYPGEKYIVKNIYSCFHNSNIERTIHHCEHILNNNFNINSIPVNKKLNATLERLNKEIPRLIKQMNNLSVIVLKGHIDMIIQKDKYIVRYENGPETFNSFDGMLDHIYLEVASDSCEYIDLLDFSNVPELNSKEKIPDDWMDYITTYLIDTYFRETVIDHSEPDSPEVFSIFEKEL